MEISEQIRQIVDDPSPPFGNKIRALTGLWSDLLGSTDRERIESAIEDCFGEELRRLNIIRESLLDATSVEFTQVDQLKEGFAGLFDAIDGTLSWNPEKHQSLYGVINRASLRAMLVDPRVSVAQKREIMDNWEQYM